MKRSIMLLLVLAVVGCVGKPKEIEKAGMTVFIKVDTEAGGKIDTGRIFYRNYSGDTTRFDTIHLNGMNWDRPMKEFQAHMDSVMNKIIKEIKK